jgi:hypothetical protein
MENGTINDFGSGIKNTLKGIVNACKEEYSGIPMQKPIQLCSKTKMGLVGLVAGGFITLGAIGATIFGAVKGFEFYLQQESRPSIVYQLDGKPVIIKRFNLNEEMQGYFESERGIQEREFYQAQNR